MSRFSICALGLLFAASAPALTGCGGDKNAPNGAAPTTTAAPASPSGATVSPGPGGKVIVVDLISDEKGNYFSPNRVTAKKGDVVRFTLKAGVHNVDFLPDSNRNATGLPSPSDMLQLPDQTFDVPVSFAPGTYYFQCDPHAALGMKGTLKVE